MDRLTERTHSGSPNIMFSKFPNPRDLMLGYAELYNRLFQLESIFYTPDGKESISTKRLAEIVDAEAGGRCVVLPEARKPLVWGDDEHNSVLCPYCGVDLMGIPYGERLLIQCPECGQYLDSTKAIDCEEAEAALGGAE